MHSSEYFRIEKYEKSHFWYRAMEELALNLLEKYRGITRISTLKNADIPLMILDAGCGTGGMTQKLERLGQVTGIDINPVALNYARKKNIKALKKASVCDLPFDNNFFDLVVSLDVLYHKMVTDDKKALSEFYRVLKPNGLVLIRVPAFEFLRGAHDITVETRHRYTADELKEKIEYVGFRIEKITYANMLLSIPLFVKRLFERRPAFGGVNKRGHSDTFLLPTLLNTFFYWYLRFENSLLNYINFPIGSSLIVVAKKLPEK